MKLSGLMFLALSSLLPPFAMAQSLPPDSGLLITRVNSEQWQIRLIAGTANQQFSGIVESDLPITAVLSTGLESTDSAKLLTPTSLGAISRSAAGWRRWREASLRVPTQNCACATRAARMCTCTAAPASLTPSPSQHRWRSAAQTPAATRSRRLLAASARKYHPGHYTIIVNGVGAQSFMTTAIQQPGMVGIVRRYSWRSLEPTQGVYDFSVIKSDLAWAAAHGTHFVVVITYKTV